MAVCSECGIDHGVCQAREHPWDEECGQASKYIYANELNLCDPHAVAVRKAGGGKYLTLLHPVQPLHLAHG
jgi:hypothetical protein